MEEAARLMGMGRGPLPAPARQALERAVAQARQLPFHSLTRPCALSFEGAQVQIDGVLAPGRDLARHLQGCREGLLVGATLGVAGDLLLRRQSLLGLTQAAAAQAALSARLEDALDQLCQKLEGERPGCHLTRRFSPGYGDLPLSFQPFLMEQLQMRRLGVTLTSALMMAPAKSVTAVVGWRPGAPPTGHKCESCLNTHCPYRAKEVTP